MTKIEYADLPLLKALCETLEIARFDLKQLLTADHPPKMWPENIWQRIARERQVVKDLESLIHEEACKLALQDLKLVSFEMFNKDF